MKCCRLPAASLRPSSFRAGWSDWPACGARRSRIAAPAFLHDLYAGYAVSAVMGVGLIVLLLLLIGKCGRPPRVA